MKYQSTKTYGNHIGISAAFRQWKAHSHCKLIHGYALGFKFVFEAQTLDDKNWVMDFGGLKELKAKLEELFDHKTVIAEDDPHLDYFKQGQKLGVLDLMIVSSAGCEKFSEYAFCLAEELINRKGLAERVKVVSAECFEHGANSALTLRD